MAGARHGSKSFARCARSKRRGERKGARARPVTIDASYVEAGAERRHTATYQLRYHWEGGGLFGGRSLRLDGLGRG